ncbi:helix-turn-helix domain-containing protein [Amycolatopsis nigrescens]|uniref:helix-turn-helix domain-containing protein n=1 Tax=Amycolatopsis nigrescens TaxID=381445 RepID=UPI003CCC1C02
MADQYTRVSPAQASLLEVLIDNFRDVATRETLQVNLPDEPNPVSENALNLHIMRLRRRISPLGLTVRTVWRRGYILEPE